MFDSLMAKPKQTPADKVIAAFGGVRATAKAVGRNPSQVSRWRQSRALGGLAGRVPAAVMPAIMSKIHSGEVSGIDASDLIETDVPPSDDMLRITVSRQYFDEIKRTGAAEVFRKRNNVWLRRLEGRFYAGVIVKPLDAGDSLEFPWNGYLAKTVENRHISATPADVFAIRLTASAPENS